MTITIIATTAQLIAALNGAVTGDIIEMAPGTYSNVSISGKQFGLVKGINASQVYIRSEFSNNPAVLTDLTVSRSIGLNFQNLKFSTATDAVGPFGTGTTLPFSISSSGNIGFWDVQVSGSPTGTLANTVSGMEISSSSYVGVEHSSFSYLHDGLAQLGDNHINISDNTFSHIYDDSVRGGGTSNITISGNSFTDLHPDPADTEHPDAIQFWTANTTAPTSNITITNNTYTRGTGGPVQGIFMNDEVGDLPYSNVTIEGNSLQGTLWNGIAVYDVHGGTINDNTLVSYSDYRSELNVYNSSSVKVESNSAGSYDFAGSSKLTLLDNVTTGPVSAPQTSEQHFAIRSLSMASPAPEPQIWALMGSGLALLGIFLRIARRRVASLPSSHQAHS